MDRPELYWEPSPNLSLGESDSYPERLYELNDLFELWLQSARVPVAVAAGILSAFLALVLDRDASDGRATTIAYAVSAAVVLGLSRSTIIKPLYGIWRMQRSIGLGLFFGVVGAFFQWGVSLAAFRLLGMTKIDWTQSSDVVTLITVAILAPVTETIIFQGWLQTRIESALTVKVGVVATAVIFIICHFGFAPGMLLMGFLLCYLRARSGGLLAPAIAHAVFNALIFFQVSILARL